MAFTVDTGMLAIFVSVILAIIGLASAWGALGQKVKRHGQELEAQKREHDADLERLHKENREDHKLIFGQLNDLNNYLRGKGRE